MLKAMSDHAQGFRAPKEHTYFSGRGALLETPNPVYLSFCVPGTLQAEGLNDPNWILIIRIAVPTILATPESHQKVLMTPTGCSVRIAIFQYFSNPRVVVGLG